MGIRKLFLPARETIFFASRVIVPFTVRTLKRKVTPMSLMKRFGLKPFRMDASFMPARRPRMRAKRRDTRPTLVLRKKPRMIAKRSSTRAVSYTHLDVYKRQGLLVD